MTRPYKKEAIAELPRATKRDLLRNKVVDMDAKFSKAISDILCSIGELRARIEEQEQSFDGELNGQDLKINGLMQDVLDTTKDVDRRIITLEAQVKKLFTTKEEKPYTLRLSNSQETRIKTLVLKLQDAIKEYNRG